MEDLVIKKKERNGEEFMTWCRKNEELKKIITRLKKEMNADKQNVKRIYEKRILELRKEENHAKTEGFNLKQRIYNLELENDAQEREIEELKQEMDEILHLRKNSETQFQIKNSSTSAKIDELIHENKKLSTTNQELLSKLSLLFSK
jgi:chromosome segregation ATPase